MSEAGRARAYPGPVEPEARRPELLTPATIRRLLDAHGIAPRKAAGQNFVIDQNTVRKIVRDAGVAAGDVVLEVGPGLGSLTLALADAADRVVAVEIDSGLVAALAEVLDGVRNVEIVHADAMRTDLGALVGGGPARFVANLPYNIATPLVLEVLEEEAFTDLFVMVQREVGQRWAAGVGDPSYGAVSVKLALAARAEVVAQVPRTVFYPVPNVDSVTVRIVRHPDARPRDERARVSRVVDRAFGQRRKTLRNSLRSAADAGTLAAAFDAAGIDPGRRAEELDVDDFVRLADALTVAERAAEALPTAEGRS